ncbi:MAG: hypothetical protein HEQ17_04340 [Limnohabitans sp.]|nr:hypothetical protein [Limnohabitans sp.]MCO4088200.1 hypothetical protein [Limnohabitans sp.]
MSRIHKKTHHDEWLWGTALAQREACNSHELSTGFVWSCVAQRPVNV